MATVNCSAIGLSYAAGDFCLPLTWVVESDEFTIDKAWIAGAFFLGLFIGAGLTALCVRPFLASWAKKKRQDEEAMLLDGTVPATPVESAKGKRFKSIEAVPVDGDTKKRKKSSRFKRRKKTEQDEEGTTHEKVEMDDAVCRGMVDVLTQTNSMSAEVEMGDQDMVAIVAMERDQEHEKETLLLKVLEFLLRKKAAKRSVTENFCDNFIKKTEQDLRDMHNMIDREKEEEEEKLKNDNKLSKDPQALESELQALQTHYNNKQAKLQRDYREKIRTDLIKSSGMSEEEVEGVMEKLMAQMSNLEEKIGQEQARQRRVLEERLAKRRQVVEYREETQKAQHETRDQRVTSLGDILRLRVKDGQLLERQNDELISQFCLNLFGLYDDLDKERTQQTIDLSDQLRQCRLDEMQALLEKQAKERSMYAKKTETASSMADIVKGYHDLLSRQHSEQEQLSLKLDEEDVKKMEQLDKEMKKKEEKGAQEEAARVVESLENLSDISSAEASKILQLHKQRMEQHEARKQRDKQAMLQQLQEKLQQRLTRASEAEAQDAQEQQMLCEEQSQTIQKVLASNMDLTEEAKDKILKQHEQNMQALSNQLQRSKMRQQKSLEMKLNQRRARMEELKKKQEDLHTRRRNMNEKEREKLEAELSQKIAAEEQKLEEARQAAVAELRKQLAAETTEALRVQDEEIGLLIARLQVGQARRKAILERQDKTLKELQDQLETKVTAGKEVPGTMTDQLLQQHYNQVEHVNRSVQRAREAQERQLAERIQQMKSQKTQEIETQLQEDAEQEYSDQQQRGAGYASLALMQTFLEQRHQRAITELEQEMTAELEKQRDELNSQMELELQKELEGQRQNLLTQLAAVSNLPQHELEDAVDAAVSGKQSEKQAKRLAKDLKQGIERAKTSMSMDYSAGDREDLQIRRARTDLEAGDGRPLEMADRRPASGKRFKKKKAAFATDIQEDDDGGF
ncbi:uncharacterized protein LOC143275994 [Babylonia areolata]|uniref:uncharacterized protein LOC143275994 n=1 Tax=Babylonia areolata TaxID=304850 RepID=UPI003FD2D311